MTFMLRLLCSTALFWAAAVLTAATYHVDSISGDDQADGLAPETAWKTLARAQKAELHAGDRLLLAGGVKHRGQLALRSLAGQPDNPIIIGSYPRAGVPEDAPAMIDGQGTRAAFHLRNSHHVRIENLVLTADGGAPSGDMRCGVLIEVDRDGTYEGITLSRLHVKAVSFQNPGYVRPEADVRTPNGRISYGWGIRFIVHKEGNGVLRDIVVRDTVIERVDHTGLKFTAPADGIRDVRVENIVVSHSGGPGVQMSGLTGGHFTRMTVDHSGSTADTRNWGRGSGLWTWGTKDVVIERSRFTNANGPGDSAGVHIDFNCANVVVQYNFSANNAGGFCEILGNNYNCAYRYNISVNDGHRVKGRDGAFQEGKILWLSGYVGDRVKPKGPFNSYVYNNTIFVSEDIVTKFTVAPSAEGVLVANNIFHIVGPSRVAASDQAKIEQAEPRPTERALVSHNLFLRTDTWPTKLSLPNDHPFFGDVGFARPGGDRLEDYIPANAELVQDRGLVIPTIPGDSLGLKIGLVVETDILGRPLRGAPDLGAIELP
jgi:hypothetical protein